MHVTECVNQCVVLCVSERSSQTIISTSTEVSIKIKLAHGINLQKMRDRSTPRLHFQNLTITSC